MDTSTRKRIVILGAGFGGLYAALELDRTVARDPGVEVLLINRQNFLAFTPMLHEVASGSLDPSSIVVPIRQVLRRVELLQAEVQSVDSGRLEELIGSARAAGSADAIEAAASLSEHPIARSASAAEEPASFSDRTATVC